MGDGSGESLCIVRPNVLQDAENGAEMVSRMSQRRSLQGDEYERVNGKASIPGVDVRRSIHLLVQYSNDVDRLARIPVIDRMLPHRYAAYINGEAVDLLSQFGKVGQPFQCSVDLASIPSPLISTPDTLGVCQNMFNVVLGFFRKDDATAEHRP